jgi:hypothetical protein
VLRVAIDDTAPIGEFGQNVFPVLEIVNDSVSILGFVPNPVLPPLVNGTAAELGRLTHFDYCGAIVSMSNARSPPFVLTVGSPSANYRRTVLTVQHSEAVPAAMPLRTVIVRVDLHDGRTVVSV